VCTGTHAACRERDAALQEGEREREREKAREKERESVRDADSKKLEDALKSARDSARKLEEAARKGDEETRGLKRHLDDLNARVRCCIYIYVYTDIEIDM